MLLSTAILSLGKDENEWVIFLTCSPTATEPKKGALVWSGYPILQVLEIH